MVTGRRWIRQGIPLEQSDSRTGARARAREASIGLDPAQDPLKRPLIAPAGTDRAGPPRRILFINQYYWPDHASTAQHLTDLAEFLARQGFECHVLSSQGRYKPGQPRPPAFEQHEGVTIHRVPATSLGRRGTLARMTDYLSFYSGAFFRALLLPRFDLVVTLTTPPIIGLIGSMLKRRRGTRHIYWSMDLHPDASLALGRMSRRSWFGRLMYNLSSAVYRDADKVVVLGPYMADRIALKNVAEERIATIPVWSRRDEIYPLPRESNPLRKSLGLERSFVAMYSGNLGLAHSFDEFLAAARGLRERSDIVFLFVGDGPRKREVQAAQESEGLSNIRLLDSVPRDRLHASLSMADAHLISMRPEMNGIVVPGKLYGAMAAGRPVIFVGPEHCEPADTVRSAGCGFTVAAGDATGLIASIEKLASDTSLARRMGERARSAFIAHYEQKLCCSQWRELIEETLGIVTPTFEDNDRENDYLPRRYRPLVSGGLREPGQWAAGRGGGRRDPDAA
jgi:glycosyltransferase involved in cell wall biosynthesis